MQLSVNGKQVDIGDALRTHIEDNLGPAVEKYFNHATDAHVTVLKGKNDFEVDIQVHVGKRIIVQSHGNSADAYAAFEESLEHITKRLRRYKRRLRDHKGRSQDEVLPAQAYVLQADDDSEEEAADNPVIIAEMPSEIETMSVSEAVMRMDLANVPAMMFRDAKHGGLNMVYKRRDGNIGWVDPKVQTGS